MSVRIKELAVPKGIIIPPCEICGIRATTKCEECRVTHYCSDAHKLIDSKAFHRSVCHLLHDIKTEPPVPFSEADRVEEKHNLMCKKISLFELADTNARKWMLEKDYEFAYPSALIAYNFAKDVWPEDGIESIYPTCLVAEMFLGLEDLTSALEYMSVASWIFQKHDVVPSQVLSKFYRMKGLTFLAMSKWEEARKCFAEFVYAIALKDGTANIRIAIPYGYLGLPLLALGDVDGAMACFHKSADKWLEWLLAQYDNKTLRLATESEKEEDKQVGETELQFLESKIVFQRIFEKVRDLGMYDVTDLINFKVLCIQALSHLRENHVKDSVVYKEEALATATRTKMDKAVLKPRFKLLVEVLGDDYIKRWEKKHNRPRTCATKYLEMIKAINV